MKIVNHCIALSGILSVCLLGCAKNQTPSTSATSSTNSPTAQTDTNAPISGSSEVSGNTPAATPNLPTIYFDYDQSTLNADGRNILQTVAPQLKDSPAKINIEGHCDERGSNEYNLALGESRAKAVRDYLKKLGVPSDKISISSFGEEKPSDIGHTEPSWAKNRRAELLLNK